LQPKELRMARILQGQKMWEELAEDPFRGLRAGPATFSPFLFPAACEPQQSFRNVESSKPLKHLYRRKYETSG
jgi:hypothetical protein